MKEDSIFRKMFSDWRVVVMVALVILSIASIYILPPNFDDGLEGNLQLGLDLEGGAWLQLGLQAEVVRFTTDRPVNDFITDLRSQLDTEIDLVDGDRLEIRKLYTQVLEDKVNNLGTRDARINTITGMNDVTHYIRIELAGADISTAQDIVGSQGKFEIRIATSGNESEHVLFGDAVTSVSTPSQYPPGSNQWGVGFTLSPEGADAFREASLKYGAVDDPENHELLMLLDGEIVYDAPLSPNLAGKLRTSTVRELSASTGGGEKGMKDAQRLEIHLRAGALPVDVEIVGSGSVPAALGDYFKFMSLLAGILALLAVAVTVYFRYREPQIVVPMICVNIAEIIILLGIARYIQQLDLASIAGLIAVLGTGIDQLVVITDEVLHEGRVPSQNLYLKRLSRALGIIMVAACTTFIAMLPLVLMGLSTLKGFAIITILGVLIGVLITRPAYGKIIL